MKRAIAVTMIMIMTLMLVLPAYAQLKKRVAVFNFENKTKQGWHWWDGRGPGDGMADMLTTELVKSGKYVVIERQEISRIIEEQRMGQSGLITAESAAQVGKLLGVELVIIGALTEYGMTKGGTGVRVKGIRVGVKSQKATVGIDVRMINTSTGVILAAENVRKESTSRGLRLSTPQGGFDNRKDFDSSVVGKATRSCIDVIMEMIEKQMEKVPWEGKIILVQGSTIYIKPGSDGGVNVGDSFTIYAPGQVLKDPDTGLVLGTVESKIGTIQVSSMLPNGKAGIANIVSGSGFEKGQYVRLK